ncbi:MAG: hypothetical protein IIA72_01310 [Proteobacteria bacterium]|nr:hypothetical protein [Pseudomonadota bacterium]
MRGSGADGIGSCPDEVRIMPDQTSESSRIGLIVASHGSLAQSLVETGELVLGRKTPLRAFIFNDGDEPKKILRQMRALARKSDQGQGVIIMVDLFGGTPGSLALSMMFGDKKVEVLTGANLPMIIAAANGGRRVPFHVNPDMFVRRAIERPGNVLMPMKDIPHLDELSAHGAEVINEPESQSLLENSFYLSGEIPRVTAYEKGLPGQVAWVDGQWEPDPLVRDERFLAVSVKDKGAIVFSACSHAGVINVLRHAREVLDPEPIYGVMGGFHLSGPKFEPIIEETVEDLREFDLKSIVPGHCTGWRAVHALVDAFGDEVVVPSAVGRLHEF